MNPLEKIDKMGLPITWKLIEIGLQGSRKIPKVLICSDVIDYLDYSLVHICPQIDKIIKLLCYREDQIKVNELIREHAEQETTNWSLQQRKWRVYLLQSCLEFLPDDCLQGLMELMEFWISMGNPKDSPLDLPTGTGILESQCYFTPSIYQMQLNKNRIWLDQEITAIQKAERLNYDIFNRKIK